MAQGAPSRPNDPKRSGPPLTLPGSFRDLFALPPLAGDDSETARLARLLHAILVSGFAIVALGTPLVAFGLVPKPELAIALNLALLAAFAGLFGLARRRRLRAASALLVAAIGLHITASLAAFGGIRAPVLHAYLIVVLVAAMLLGFRAALVTMALSLAAAAAILLAERSGLLEVAAPAPHRVFTVFVINLAVLLGLTYLAVRDLQGANRLLRAEVAERRHVEARLRESEARFRSIVESSPMGVHLYRLEPDGRLVLTGANPASSRILGFDASGLVGLPLEEAFPSLSRGGIPDRFRRICREGGAVSSDDLPVSDPRFEGSVQLYAFQTAPGMMAVMILDVTGKRRAEAERRALEEQLRHSQKMEAVGRLAGGIAHDFNNLLMVIMGHGELLRRSLGPEDPRQRKLEQVLGASDRASRLVRQLLAFSSKQVMEPQVVDLGEVVRETARMLRPLLGEDVRVTTRVEASLWRARVDPAQVEQVLVNLAVNARDAMPAGGALSLEAANAEVDGGGPVPPGGYVALFVRDTGHGMDEATRAKVFEPFFTTKTRSGGTGLGLAMVYGIVQQSGGHIDLETARGEGTTFRILFPRHDGELRPAAARPLPSRREASGETVLVAEDEPAIRNLACEMLEAQGYTAIGARSGEEALALARRADPGIDLLLTDVVMPGMSGRELVERFRELRPRTRVLFMSGYAGDDLTSRGVAEEGAHFIPKPFTPELLAERVREALDRAD